VTFAPDRRGLRTDVRVVRLLEISAAPCEGREHSGGHLGFEDRLGGPAAWPDVDEIDGGACLVKKQRSVDASEPEETVGIAGPHKRSVGHIGEPRDAALEPIVVVAGITEADESLLQRAIDGRLQVDLVAAGSHRRSVDLGHPRYCALEMETFKRYLLIQAIIFVFGIVGPIFLIMFFASPRDPELRWAYWAGLFITTADILIALALTAASDEKKSAKKAKAALALQNRKKSGRSESSGSSSSSSSSDPFFPGGATFFSSDSGSSSDSGWFSSDSGSSSSDSSSFSDSGSSSSDSGSSSSSSD